MRLKRIVPTPLRSACLLAALLILPAGLFAVVRQPLHIGVLAYLGEEVAEVEWAPMAKRLAIALPSHSVELVLLDHEGMRKRATEGRLDFIITNPGHYVELEAELGASRILTLDSDGGGNPAHAIGSAVITRTGRDDLTRLEDLRGRRVAVVSKEAFGGYQVVWREWQALGLAPDSALLELREVGFPMDRVFQAVRDGEVDAGIVRSCLLESRPELDGVFKVVGARPQEGYPCEVSTRLYPDWPIATLRHTPPALARQVAIALLALPAGENEPTWAVPADYQSVHELFRELQIGPYAYLRAPTLMALAERYWPVLAAMLTLLVGWVLYTVRVEHLIHIRTSALRDALAERDAIQERMRKDQEQADHLARLSVLGELSGTLAHELNQPLATIGNYAQSLVRRADAGRLTEAATREAAGEIAGQAERAAAILGRIRAFAKKRIGQREVREVAALVSEAIDLFRGMLAQAPEVELQDRLPPGRTIEVDGLQIQQVLLNLLKNGYDACRELPETRRKLIVMLEPYPAGIRIAVRDHGPGLAPAIRERLFEPFLTTKPDGLGLGLSICQTIAEAHGGRLSGEAASDGPGMIFTLVIPDHD